MVEALPGLAGDAVFAAGNLVKDWHEARRPYRLLSRLDRKAGQLQHILEASAA